jgi:hypothetical protein
MKQLRGKVAAQNMYSKMFFGRCIPVIVPTKCTVLNQCEHWIRNPDMFRYKCTIFREQNMPGLKPCGWYTGTETCQSNIFNLRFCWPCITVYQYSENNVMNFLFNLLRIKGLYKFRALLAHPQEVLNKRHLVYCVRVVSVGCYRDWSVTGVPPVPLQS